MNKQVPIGLSQHSHPTLYTVVEAGTGTLVASRFKDAVAAQRYLERIRMRQPGSILLPPSTNS